MVNTEKGIDHKTLTNESISTETQVKENNIDIKWCTCYNKQQGTEPQTHLCEYHSK